MPMRRLSPKERMDKIKRRRELNSELGLPEYVLPFKEGVYRMRIIAVYPMRTLYGDKVVMELQGEVDGVTIKEKKFFDGGRKINDQSELGILLNSFGIVGQDNHIHWHRLKEDTVSVDFGMSNSGKAYIKKIEPLVDDEDEAFSEDEEYEEDDYEYEDEEDE